MLLYVIMKLTQIEGALTMHLFEINDVKVCLNPSDLKDDLYVSLSIPLSKDHIVTKLQYNIVHLKVRGYSNEKAFNFINNSFHSRIISMWENRK